MTDILGEWETTPTIQDDLTAMLAHRSDEIQTERERAAQDKARRENAIDEAAETLGRLLEEADNA